MVKGGKKTSREYLIGIRPLRKQINKYGDGKQGGLAPRRAGQGGRERTGVSEASNGVQVFPDIFEG